MILYNLAQADKMRQPTDEPDDPSVEADVVPPVPEAPSTPGPQPQPGAPGTPGTPAAPPPPVPEPLCYGDFICLQWEEKDKDDVLSTGVVGSHLSR